MRSDAGELVKELADVTGAPIVTTLPARGIVPDSDPKVLGMLGMHGTIAATAPCSAATCWSRSAHVSTTASLASSTRSRRVRV